VETREWVGDGIGAEERRRLATVGGPGQTRVDGGVITEGDPLFRSSIAGDRCPESTTPTRDPAPRIESQLSEGTWAGALDNDVRASEESFEDGSVLCLMQIEGTTLFIGVEKLEESFGSTSCAIGA
jgi:hypothetical protein